MATCKDCKWAVMEQGLDFRLRSCHGGPPQVLLVPQPGPGGQMGMGFTQRWPAVAITDPICGQFKPREPLDSATVSPNVSTIERKPE